MTTEECVYLQLREYFPSGSCPWTTPSALTRDVADCLGPGKCLYVSKCQLCKLVASFPTPLQTQFLGEIEELRTQIHLIRHESTSACPTCGIIKTYISDGLAQCKRCNSKSTPEKQGESKGNERIEGENCDQEELQGLRSQRLGSS